MARLGPAILPAQFFLSILLVKERVKHYLTLTRSFKPQEIKMDISKVPNFEVTDSDQITAAGKELAVLAMAYGAMWSNKDSNGSKTGSKVVMSLATALAFAVHEIARPGMAEPLANDMHALVGDILKSLAKDNDNKPASPPALDGGSVI